MRKRRSYITNLSQNQVPNRPAGKQRVVTPLLKFFKATEIEARERTRQKELEWKKKNNQGREELLG